MINQKRINRLKTYAEILTIFFIDIALIISLFYLSVFVRTNVLPFLYEGFPEKITFSTSILSKWWIFIIWIFFFYYEGLYTKRYSFWDEIKALWKVSFFSTIGIFTIVSIGKLSGEISRTISIFMGIFAVLFLPIIRINAKKIFRKLGFFKKRVLILGAGETGRLIAGALRKEPIYGYNVIGFLDDDPEKIGKYIDGIKIHGGLDNAFKYVNRCNISDLFIAMPHTAIEKIQRLINSLQHRVDSIMFIPDMSGMAVLGTNLQHFFQEQVFALEIKNNLERPVNIFIKRCFDMLVCIIFILILAIPMAIISFLIKLDSDGPAIFSQDRVGKKGKNFRCYKFRTMYKDAEKRLQEIFANDVNSRLEWKNFRKLKDDPRITGIGRFLRETSLDELPQLFNVLKGEMSLVGPRPVTQDEIDKYYKDTAVLCFSVPPGVTGLWQVSGRSNTGYDYRIALDSWYVKNWNLWLDIVILFKTVRVVLNKEGAR